MTVEAKIEPVAAEGGSLTVGLSLTRGLDDRLDREAKRLGTSKSELVRHVLREWLSTRKDAP